MCCPISTRLGHSVELSFFGSWSNKRSFVSCSEVRPGQYRQGALHQGTALAHADDLFPRDGEHEFQKVPVKVGIAYFAEQF